MTQLKYKLEIEAVKQRILDSLDMNNTQEKFVIRIII